MNGCSMATLVGGVVVHCFLFAVAFRRALVPNARRNRRARYRLCVQNQALENPEPCRDPWINATIDYSGANEYVEAHYGNHPLLPSFSSKNVPYFSRENSRDGKATEPIFNARELLQNGDGKSTAAETRAACNVPDRRHRHLLETYGMTLVHAPTKVTDWTNRTQIEEVYLPELETVLAKLFPAGVRTQCFWNPMLRGDLHTLSSSTLSGETASSIQTASVASAVHIDTDVGAYGSVDDLLAIVEANRVTSGKGVFDRRDCSEAIAKDGRRFAVVNFWRSTHPTAPVTTSPLAILSTRYNGTETGSAKTRNQSPFPNPSAFPYARPDWERSKWYGYPNMTNDEVLVFYQYDRLVTQPSDLWHCAIDVAAQQRTSDPRPSEPPRESFDIRVLVVWDEVVPGDRDRFGPERVRPVLSFEESGCFCDEQAVKRGA